MTTNGNNFDALVTLTVHLRSNFIKYTNGDNGDPLVICTIVAIGTMIDIGIDWDNGTDGAISGNGDNCDLLFTVVFICVSIEYPMVTIATIEAIGAKVINGNPY